jgi:hypothetical protein
MLTNRLELSLFLFLSLFFPPFLIIFFGTYLILRHMSIFHGNVRLAVSATGRLHALLGYSSSAGTIWALVA